MDSLQNENLEFLHILKNHKPQLWVCRKREKKERKKDTGLPFLVTCEIPKASKREVRMMRVNKLPFLKQGMSFDHHSCAWIFLCCYKYDYHWLLGSGQESAGVCWNKLLALDNYY
jgi:hypothetical protein